MLEDGTLSAPAKALIHSAHGAEPSVMERCARVRCAITSKQLIGWYRYYLRASGLSEVGQIAGRNGSFDPVLERLLVDA